MHAGERPPSLDEAVAAASTTEEKISVCVDYANTVPEVEWEIAGGYLMRRALRERGIAADSVAALLAAAATAAQDRVAALVSQEMA